MKVSVLRTERHKEVIKRVELEELVSTIKKGAYDTAMREVREVYHLMNGQRIADGQIATSWKGGIKLPRICFTACYRMLKGDWVMMEYNGLVTLEVNNLPTYEKAVEIRELAKQLPETMLCFLGGSGRSVKIVCRGELYGGGMPQGEPDIRQFHLNIYNTARRAYQNQFGFDIEFMEPRMDRTVYMSADPEMGINMQARPFYGDTKRHDQPQPISISHEEDYLMPGRTVTRTYHLNWMYIVETVMGHYFDLPDEDKTATLLMEIASACLEQGIPLSHAQGLTLLHPVLNTDRLLVEKIFQTVYSVNEEEEYRKKHKVKPLKSVPEDTLNQMKTEIFLNSHYEMRKNLLTGVAEYREKFSDNQVFMPLTPEVRNSMSLTAIELGLKGFDKNMNRFIDSMHIEQYDPVNKWLDDLPKWDGKDRIKALARRVPTGQPHWEKYLRYWLVGMVAQWRESDRQLTGNALTPLLIGRQGCGKTRFCKILLPPELRDYYNDKINFKNEFDLNIALTSFALINIDEFDKTTSSQQIVLKYLLSSADVKFRPPYGKTIKQFRRYTSFIATTNQMKPLVDPTGSRRFVCVGVTGNINFEDNLEHEQLYAQALHLFNNGQRFWLSDSEIQTLIKENEPYQRLNDLVEMIGETFRSPKDTEQGKWWSLSDISDYLTTRYTSFDKDTPFQKIGNALNDILFNFKSKRTTQHMEYWLIEK